MHFRNTHRHTHMRACIFANLLFPKLLGTERQNVAAHQTVKHETPWGGGRAEPSDDPQVFGRSHFSRDESFRNHRVQMASNCCPVSLYTPALVWPACQSGTANLAHLTRGQMGLHTCGGVEPESGPPEMVSRVPPFRGSQVRVTAAGLRTRPFSPLLGDGNWAVLIQAKLHPQRNLENYATLRHTADSAVNIYTPVFCACIVHAVSFVSGNPYQTPNDS